MLPGDGVQAAGSAVRLGRPSLLRRFSRKSCAPQRRETPNHPLLARPSLIWAPCGVVNPRHSFGYVCGLRLAGHPNSGRSHSRGTVSCLPRAFNAVFAALQPSQISDLLGTPAARSGAIFRMRSGGVELRTPFVAPANNRTLQRPCAVALCSAQMAAKRRIASALPVVSQSLADQHRSGLHIVQPFVFQAISRRGQ